MNDLLKPMWDRLECIVINPLSKDRRVVDKTGKRVIGGGFQNELQYLQIYHPEIINN